MKLLRFNEASYAHFVTIKTFENKPIFEDEKCCEILLKDVDFYRQKLGFRLLGYVIMLDHLHLIVWWEVEELPELTISKIMHDIKGLSAQNISRYLLGSRGVSASTARRGAKASSTRWGRVIRIWQKSFYDFNIYSEEKLREKLNYIHWNLPLRGITRRVTVRAGLCKRPEDWPWSSYKFYEYCKQGKIIIDTIG